MIGLAPSSYYYRPMRDPKSAPSDAELRDRIERIHLEFPGYGYRMLKAELQRQGVRVNAKRIRRVQQEYKLFPVVWRTFRVATADSDRPHPVYPNLLRDRAVTGLNRAWVADIAYIRILTGFLYLAAILDRYSRKAVGWAISRRIDTALCLAALTGRARRPPAAARLFASLGPRRAVLLGRLRGGAERGGVCDRHVPHGQSLR